jgi:hypothetical protein
MVELRVLTFLSIHVLLSVDTNHSIRTFLIRIVPVLHYIYTLKFRSARSSIMYNSDSDESADVRSRSHVRHLNPSRPRNGKKLYVRTRDCACSRRTQLRYYRNLKMVELWKLNVIFFGFLRKRKFLKFNLKTDCRSYFNVEFISVASSLFYIHYFVVYCYWIKTTQSIIL